MKIFFPALLLSLISTAAVAAVTESIHETHALNADGEVELVNVNGNIEISAWDKNEVSIEAEKNAKTEDDLKNTQVKIESGISRITINTNYPEDSRRGMNSSVTYTLHVPAGARLAKIKGVNSNITVNGVRGGVSCETVNGSVKVFGAANTTSLVSVNGRVFAESDQLPSNSHLSLKTVNGGCEVRLASTVNATVSAHTVHGGIHCDFPGAVVGSRRDALTATLGSGGASVNLSAVNGGVTVAEK